MNPEVIDKIKEVMAPVADKIGQGAEFGWEVVMRQQYVYAVEGAFYAILGFVGCIVVWKFVRGVYIRGRWDDAAIMVSVFGGGLSIIAFLVGSEVAISRFINPSYYALQFFIGLVK